MANLRFTNLPERGDVALGELKTKKVLYIKEGSFGSAADIDLTKYEVLGVVYKRDGNDVKIVYTANASRMWCERWILALTVTEGTTEGTLAVNDASAWGTFTVYSIPITSYADTTEGKATLVSELNAFFRDVTNPVFQTQDWVAYVDADGKVCLNYAMSDYRQATATYKPSSTTINRGGGGFTVANNTLAEIPALANMLRKNGATGGEGAIGSMTKALDYFKQDLSSTSYNPNSNVTSVKRTYPICLPGYLGQSAYRKDGDSQLDYCSALRAVYGEGERGWLKFMESCLPVIPTDWGNMGWSADRAAEYTRTMAAKRYTSQKKTNEPMCKAAYYCDSITRQTLPAHSYRLPTTQEIAELLDGVQYNVVNNRNADILNKTLNKLGGTAISCSSAFWSAFRGSAGVAWSAHGNLGFFGYGSMYGSFGSAPVSLLKLA